MNKKSGIIILNKEQNMTSQTAVNRVKRLFSADKAGHTGTLDPMATGVLPILINRAVKAGEYMLSSEKHYLAECTLGITTDTEDISGEVLTRCEDIPNEERVLSVSSQFVGEIMQTPPMYSAIRVNGTRLMELARKGEVVEREARPITVYSLKAERLDDNKYSLDIECSKGTYIRTVCADIGKELGCGATMSALCRLEAAGFTLDEAHTISEIEKMSEEQREALIIPVEKIFEKYEIVTLPDFYAELAHNGASIYQKKIRTSHKNGEFVRLYDKNGFFAIGQVVEKDGESVIKPQKQFVL